MNVLVSKLCSNIRFAGKETNGGQTEIAVVLDLLKKSGHKPTVLTLERYAEDAPEGVEVVTLESLGFMLGGFDMIMMFNGPLNCYGGQVSDETLATFKLLAAPLPKIYAVTDTSIPIGDLASWLRGAQAKGSYLYINPSEYEVPAKSIFCLTQTYDLSCLKNHWRSKENSFGGYGHFPFETTVLFRKDLITSICDTPSTDLIYYGNPRSGRRDKKFVDYYCNQPADISVKVYGNWTDSAIANLSKKKSHRITNLPQFLGKMDMYKLHGEINRSYAHCYISDVVNEGTIWTTRFYEAIMNRCILFVDADNDPKMVRFDPFFYVRGAGDLASKIKMLKADNAFRVKMLDKQLLSLKPVIDSVPHYHTMLDNNLQKAKDLYAENVRS